ncbi:MAG: penicillin-binding protein 2 [Lachnospiraceae bacterium]|nr:penicillin-binding protein 2 [Lachnospiraceae bacterium]
MAKRNQQNGSNRFTQRMSIKLAVLFVMILVAFAFLGIRLFIINRDNGDKYKKRVLSQQAYDSITIPAKRGDIVDRNNTKLAVSQKVYNVCIDPKTLNKDDGANLESTITALYASPIEFSYTKDELRSYILANPNSQYRIIARKQGYETVSDIMNMVNNPSMYPDFKGVWLEDTYVRQYPYNSLACDVIGFVQGDNEGAYGLEEFYNSTLVGTNGREYGYLNDDENLERTLKPAQDGKTLVTSIDVNIQSIVEKNILAFNEEHRNEAREGAGSTNTGVIVMDPNNGEVLAMASYPTFNLNDPRNTDNLDIKVELDPEKFGLMNGILDGNTDISEMDDSELAETVRKLAEENKGEQEAADNPEAQQENTTENPGNQTAEDDSSNIEINVGNKEEDNGSETDDPYEGLTYAEAYDKAYEEAKMEALNSLWKNFCINSTYEPGSTMKPFTMAAGLEEGILKGDESYVCNGVTEVGGHEIHCSNRLGHGTLTFSGALEQSCNVAFMKIGTAIGKTIFMKYNQLFNFGLKTNIDLTGEALTNSLVFDVNTMTPTDLAISSFGQGFNVTMIQMATGFCSLINGGYYYKPHVVTKVLDSAGTTVETVEPRVLKQTVSEETSEKIRELCVAVVDNGTGKSARPAGYRIGGKTGTAEKYPRGTENYVISFMSFAPADDPQIVCYVVIDEPNVGYQAQSKYAAVLCKDILTEVLPYMGIFQTEELTEKEAEELAEKQQEFSTGSSGTESEEEVTGEIIVDSEGNNNESAEGSENSAITFVDESGNKLDEEDRTGEKVEIDPETGYAIDPTTGILLDPQTGEPIDPTVTDLQ